MKKETIITMDYGEFEEIVRKAYGIRKYSFVATECCGNDSQHKFYVTGKDPLDEWQQENIEKVKADNTPEYSNYGILQDLVNRDVLEPGIYLIEVCW